MANRRHSRFRPRPSATHGQEAVPSNSEPVAAHASASPVALDLATLEDNVARSPGFLPSLNSDQPSTLSPDDHPAQQETVKTLGNLLTTGNARDIELWNDTLPSGASDAANLPAFGTSDLIAHVPADLVADNDDLMFAGFPDADILEQYLNYTDVFDPSLTEPLYVDFMPELPSKPRDDQVVHDEAYVFNSPLAWVADWSVENLRGDPRYAEVVEQRVFNLPRISEILTLLRLYFSHAHHRLPVLNEHYFYLLTDQRHNHGSESSLEPISLALLYAIMFSACSYLRTETTEAPLLRAIRSMRCEYYSRAATLFKLGCESDPLRQVQICLVLSTYRNYPGQFYENERWIIKAYRTLQESRALPSKSEDRGFVDQVDWKRACACWLHRFTNSQLGLKWTNSPDLMEASWFPWHQISLSDFQDDFSFSWHLNADVKKQLTLIFVKRIDLNVHFCHLNKVLWKRTASEMIATGEALDFTQAQSSDALPIEEIEARLQKWKLNHASLLSRESPITATPFEKRLLRAELILTKLAYELVLPLLLPCNVQKIHRRILSKLSPWLIKSTHYFSYAMCSLYQDTLIIDRHLITEWGAAMIRSSRAALWKSIDSIRQSFKDALNEKLVLLLPLNMLIVVFAPLTIYSIYMRKVQVFDASAIENLATCSQVAKTMIDLHDGADFYGAILSNTLALADKYKTLATSDESEVVPADTRSPHAPVRADVSADIVLPDPQLHSLILRFHNLALALGRMPKMEAVMPKLSHQKKPTLDVAS